MKNILKNPIFAFILGIIITGSIGVVASGIFASNITYDNTTSGLKDSNDQNVTTVQGAIDALTSKVNEYNCKFYQIQHLANTQINYDFGFVPSRLLMFYNVTSVNQYFTVAYKIINNSLFALNGTTTENLSGYYAINSSRLVSTFPTNWALYSSNYTMYAIACK